MIEERLEDVEAWVCAEWMSALTDAWKLALTESRRRLLGLPLRTFDKRNLHPFTEAVARIRMCESLVPTLMVAQFDHLQFRRMAEVEAVAEIARDISRRGDAAFLTDLERERESGRG